MDSNKNILVTGGAGFIGSHLVDELILQGFKVSIIDNLSTGKLENINMKAVFYNADIVTDDLSNIFKKECPSIVIHLAAQVSVSNANSDPIYDAKENIIGTLNILEYCKKYNVKQFVAASSAAVYGEQETPINEDAYLQPMSNYGLSKLTMEKYIQLSGIDYIICRFSNVFGPRQTIEGEAGVVTIFENAMKNNLPVYIYGDGEQIRDFIYVKDIAKILCKLIEIKSKNIILNLSTQKGTSINDLFYAMSNMYQYKKMPIYQNARKNDITKSILNNNLLLKIIEEYTFADIKRMNRNEYLFCNN